MYHLISNLQFFEQYTILCFIDDYIYLKEYIEASFSKNRLFIYDKTTKIPDGVYLSLRRVPLLESKKQLIQFTSEGPLHDYSVPLLSPRCTMAFLNLEHYTDEINIKYNKMFITPSVKVFDYSKDNINIFGYGTHIPYIENPRETAALRRFMNVKKTTDISIVGTPSKRRNLIVEALRKYYKVDYIQAFGEERDRRIGQSRILLNIHMRDNWKIYESLRCERWRFAGMKIVSEKCISSPPEIIVTDYSSIVDQVIRIFGKP